MFSVLRKSYRMVARDHPARWVLIVLFAVAASGLEILGALMVFLLLGLVADPGGRFELPIVGDVREAFDAVPDATFIIVVVVALAVFFVLRASAQVAFAYAKHRLAHTAGARLSTELMRGYLRMPYAFHLRRNSSELVRNAYQTVDDLSRHCFLQVIYVVAESVVVAGLLGVLLVVAPWATALAIVVVGAAALVLLLIVQPRMKRLGATAQAMRKTTLASMQQSLHGLRDIKVLGAEDAFGTAYRRDRARLARTLYLRGAVSELPRHVIELALLGFILAVLAMSVAGGAESDQLLSMLGLFAYAGLRVQPSLQKIVGGLNNIRFSAAAVDQIYDDYELLQLMKQGERAGSDLTFDDALRLENVSFTYERSDRPAIQDVDLAIRPGEVIGMCGPTGSGKTTLTDLLTGLLEPTRGRVTVDGTELRESLSSWFSMLGVVPQMVFLIDDTLRHNIALGVDDDEVDEEALGEAIRMAQLEDFVASLPEGLETVVGERGVRVSGGQRQRVAIARALYRRPRVLIFDEGTSALDNSTEAILMSSLERLRGRHTIILVAHRLSTVRNCDRILYVEGGRVQATGSYDQLRDENERFRALADRG